MRRRPQDTAITLIDSTPNSVSPKIISKYDGSRSTNTKEKLPEILTLVILPTTETNKMNSNSDNYNNSNEAYINWKLILGHCSNNVVLNTLKHTTQYFADSVESEVRAYPRQHCQKQVIPLYLKRIQIRAAGDTFFLSFKSIRGYTYTQLFVLLAYDFLQIQCLRRESQVASVYQDFCREVGAPNELLTDNSMVQSGEKFKKINRENITQHNFTTPHC